VDCTCPSCASGDTRKLSLIYAGGAILARKPSVHTVAASLAAPPKPLSYAGPMVILFLAFLIIADIVVAKLPPDAWFVRSRLGSFLQAVFLFAPPIGWLILAYRYNRTTWRRLLERWGHSFQCGRCGRVFVVA